MVQRSIEMEQRIKRQGIHLTRAAVAATAFTAALLGAAPGWAGTKEDDAAKMVAEWAAIPDGTVAPAVADALAFEAGWGPGPVLQEVVYEMPAQRPLGNNDYLNSQGNFEWTHRATLSQISPTLFKLETLRCVQESNGAHQCSDRDTRILDRSGLLVPFEKEVSGFNFFDVSKMSTLSLLPSQTAIATAAAISDYISTMDKRDYYDSSGYTTDRTEYDCHISVQGLKADVDCKTSGIWLNPGPTAEDPGTQKSSFLWNTAFNIYLPEYPHSDACYEDTCDGHSHKIIDNHLAGGDWHSKAVSAALSAADRARALALFLAGFESFKSGDFVGAVALLQKGLTIDPANHLAYFTLAECARSAWINNQDDHWERDVAFYYYRRTVDLAPDSPEGVRAQGRLDGGLK